MSKRPIIDHVDFDIDCEKSQKYPYLVELIHNWKVWGHYVASRDAEMLPWCEENCQGKYMPGRFTYRWKFEKLEDVVAFKLRWNGHSYYTLTAQTGVSPIASA